MAPKYHEELENAEKIMAATTLDPLPSRVGVVPSCIAASCITLSMSPTDRFSKDFSTTISFVSATNDVSIQPGTTLFSVSPRLAKNPSNEVYIEDSNGLPILQMKLKSMFSASKTLYVPATDRLKQVGTVRFSRASLSEKYSASGYKLDLELENVAGNGEQIVVQIRGFEKRGVLYNIMFHGKLAAKAIRKSGFQSHESPTWEIKIAQGFDMALVVMLVMLLCRMHAGSHPPSTACVVQ